VLAVGITLLGVLAASCGDDAPVTRESASVASASPASAATASVTGTAPAPTATTSTAGASPTPALTANQQPPLATFQRYVDALNRGDVDGALAAFAQDGRLADLPRLSVTHPCRPAQECVGHAAIRPELEARVASHRCVTVLTAAEAGEVVIASVQLRHDGLRMIGVEYIVQNLRVVVGGDQIVTLESGTDLSDENTRRASAISAGVEPRGTPLPAPATPCG
jgi:hypothetical protein